jgi:hypothetical protein
LFQPQKKLFRRSATGPGTESGSGDQP